MASILSLLVTGTLPVAPSGRIAAGRSKWSVAFSNVMPLCITGFETVKRRLSNDDAKTRAG
jgi:hypothetical protein